MWTIPRRCWSWASARLAELEVRRSPTTSALAQMRGTVQYAAYKRLERFELGDTAVLHSAAVWTGT